MRHFLYFLFCFTSWGLHGQKIFSHELNSEQFPWTENAFDNAEEQFQFAIVSDRTGGHRAGVFGHALGKLNRMHPEFVMSVGDLIEGYTKDVDILDAQWAEFDSILNRLNMRFFALPGNHDISNEVMRQMWLDRYGRSYYHFRYKDVLFLAFDSNDGEGVMFSEEQINYFKQALSDNKDVRWTLVFMHHPIWNFSAYNGFAQIEEALKERPYTVFAGHTHRYFKTVRQDRNYYVLSTTGGGSRLRGPRVGEFDHITWVTMTEDGPDLLHLELSGLVEGDVLTEETAALAMILNQAAQIEHLTLQGSEDQDKILIRMANQLPERYRRESSGAFRGGRDSGEVVRQELIFEGRFYHNHHLAPEPNSFEVRVPVDDVAQIAIDVSRMSGIDREDIDDLELDYTVWFEGEPFAPEFRLSGTQRIDFSYPATGLRMTDQDIFLQEHQVSITADFPDAVIRYTTDGSDPDAQDPVFDSPILLRETTTVKARYFSQDNEAVSSVVEKTYQKTIPAEPVVLSVNKLKPGLRYAYYEGDFSERVPDFEYLNPVDEGVVLDSDPNRIAERNNMRKDHFAIAFEGYIEIPRDDIYTFYTTSDDGSILYINDQEVVNNDGSHSTRTRTGYIALKKGWVPIRIGYFDDFLGETLRIGLIEADGTRREIPFSALRHQPK